MATDPVKTAAELFHQAVANIAGLEERARTGDAGAAQLYRQVIEMAVRQWSFALPDGEKASGDLSPLLEGRAHGSREELALLWALGVARRNFPDGEVRFLESARHKEFKRYADNWIEVFWRRTDKYAPPGLREKLKEKSQDFDATGPEYFADRYLLRRAEFFVATREHPRYFDAKFIRNHVSFFVLADFVEDSAVVDELDRPRRVKPEHVRHKRAPDEGMTKHWLILCWLAGRLWQSSVSEHAEKLTELVRAITKDDVRSFTFDQLRSARNALGLL